MIGLPSPGPGCALLGGGEPDSFNKGCSFEASVLPTFATTGSGKGLAATATN